MKTIAIFSQLANGKDTLGDYLCIRLNERKLSGQWNRAAFANAVKKVYQDAFGVDRNFIEKWKRITDSPPGMKMNVRKALQFIGDGFRQIKDEIWIEIALRGEENKILSDGRYLNEAKTVKNLGGINILLWRPLYENDDPNPSEAQIRPPVDWCVNKGIEGLLLENQLPDEVKLFDFFIRNDGTLDDFYKKIDSMLVPHIEKQYAKKNISS